MKKKKYHSKDSQWKVGENVVMERVMAENCLQISEKTWEVCFFNDIAHKCILA